MIGAVRYRVRSWRARWHYRGSCAPCRECVWEPGDGSVRFSWISCARCEWGNE